MRCSISHRLSLFVETKAMFFFSAQGLNNIIHIDFDYKKEFIYWVDSTRPSGRKINRMRLNGSDLKVSRLCRTSGLLPQNAKLYWLLLLVHKTKKM